MKKSERLTIEKNTLEKTESDFEYLQAILDKYDDLWKMEPEKFMENFNESQITLLFYGVLYNQVQNGGFLQLIFNGYAPYIFSEPMVNGLKEFGAVATAELIKSITNTCLQIANKIDKTSLKSLSKNYSQYPEFEDYDNAFYANNGLKEVRNYVSLNLSNYITIE